MSNTNTILPTRAPGAAIAEEATMRLPVQPRSVLRLFSDFSRLELATGVRHVLDLTHRKPLMSARKVRKMAGAAAVRGGALEGAELVGSFMTPFQEGKFAYEWKEDQAIQQASLAERDALMDSSTFYVFRVPSRKRRQPARYLVASPFSLARADQGPASGIMELTPGSKLTIGREGWLPAVGHDNALVRLDQQIADTYSRVSKAQAELEVDQNGVLYFRETDERKNPTLVDVRLTRSERKELDRQRRHTALENDRLARTHRLQAASAKAARKQRSRATPPLLGTDYLEMEHLYDTHMLGHQTAVFRRPRVVSGRLTGHRHTPQHARPRRLH